VFLPQNGSRNETDEHTKRKRCHIAANAAEQQA
jgi:hypothetical protein